MQDQLCIAIMARLAGSETMAGDQATAKTNLASALATDTDSVSGPAVTQGNRDDVVGFPAVTFRASGGMEALGGIGAGVVRDYFFDFEIWTNSTSGRVVHQIADYVEILLDERRGAPVLPVSSGKEFYCESMNAVQPFYDDKINAWAGLVRYHAVAGQG